MSRRRTLGEKLEAFYLALLTTQTASSEENLFRLVYTLNELENHQVNELEGETPDVIQDILKDARKKSSVLIRTPYIEQINQLITSSRKKLRAKAALDNDSNIQHGQRHVYLFIELLGSWSNIIVEIMNLKSSKDTIQLILSQLHQRVIEMSFECFQTFKQDKDLENLCIKALQGPSSQNSYDLINLNALDNVVDQISTMRQIINQHYLFLFNTFTPFFSSPDSENPILYSFLEQLLIVNKEEILKWKEIDAIYLALENAYLQQSILEACLQFDLISIEENIFLLQSLEDAVFLFHKILERTVQTNEEKNVFMISQKILELCQFQLPSSFSATLQEEENAKFTIPLGSSSANTFLFFTEKMKELMNSFDNLEEDHRSSFIPMNSIFGHLLTTKKVFHSSIKREKIHYTKLVKRILAQCTGRDYLLEDPNNEPQTLEDLKNKEDGRLSPKPNSKSGNLPTVGSGMNVPESTKELGKSNSSAPNSGNYQTPLKPAALVANNLVSNLMESNGIKQALETRTAIKNYLFAGNNLSEDGTTVETDGSVANDLWNGVATASMKGVNQWIGGWASPYIANNENGTSKSPIPLSPNRKGNNNAVTSVEELLLKALDLHDDDEEHHADTSFNSNDSRDAAVSFPGLLGGPQEKEEFIYNKLPESDLITYFNCFLVLIKTLISIRMYLLENGLSVLSTDQIIRQSSSSSSSSSSSLENQSVWIVIKEYSKCEQSYETYLLYETKSYIQQKHFRYDRIQQEKLYYQQLEQGVSGNPNELQTKVKPADKIFRFKYLIDRNYEMTGQEMEEKLAENSLKFYFYSFLLFFPFNSSYFKIHDETYSKLYLKNGNKGDQSTSHLPSFLSNPLTSFLFTSSDNNGNDSNDPTKDEKDKETMNNTTSSSTSSSYSFHGYLSEENFILFFTQIIIFFNQLIIHEIIQKKSFNEWGALLLYEEILSYQKAYDQIILPYQELNSNNNMMMKTTASMNHDHEDTHNNNNIGFQSISDRNQFYIFQSKKSFMKLINIMKILTLDAPSDIRRYHYLLAANTTSSIPSPPPSSSSALSANTSDDTLPKTIPKENKEKEKDRFTEEELRFYLSRRIEFSRDAIQKIKLTM